MLIFSRTPQDGAAVEGPTGVTLITDLLSPPSGADGDYGYHAASGSVYRYSSVYSAWIPGEVYEGTPALVCQHDGDVLLPSGWAKVENGTGTVTTDGTRCTYDGTTINSDYCWLHFDTVLERGSRFYYRVAIRVLTSKAADNLFGAPAMEFSTTTLQKRRIVGLERGPTDRSPFLLDTSAEIGAALSGAAGLLSTEKLVEWVVDHSDESLAGLTKQQLYVDGVLVAYCGRSTAAGVAYFNPGLEGSVAIGDMSTVAVCSFTHRLLKFGSW